MSWATVVWCSQVSLDFMVIRLFLFSRNSVAMNFFTNFLYCWLMWTFNEILHQTPSKTGILTDMLHFRGWFPDRLLYPRHLYKCGNCSPLVLSKYIFKLSSIISSHICVTTEILSLNFLDEFLWYIHWTKDSSFTFSTSRV